MEAVHPTSWGSTPTTLVDPGKNPGTLLEVAWLPVMHQAGEVMEAKVDARKVLVVPMVMVPTRAPEKLMEMKMWKHY